MEEKKLEDKSIPLLDCPIDYLIGDASGKVMNEYGRFPCKLKCYTYAFLVRGSAEATLNIDRYHFTANDVLLIEPGTFLLIHEFSEDALVYYILFSSEFIEKYTFGRRMTLQSMQMPSPIIHLSEERSKVIIGMMDVLLGAINCTPSMMSTEKMVHIFNLFQTGYAEYAKSQAEYSQKPQNRKLEIYMEYQKLVLDHHHEWHHVAEYADAMRLSLPHLCSSIKQASGKTAGDLISDAIIVDAKSQLKITNLQIKEIAISLGFDNVAFFNRFFKAHTGVTPKEYRLS